MYESGSTEAAIPLFKQSLRLKKHSYTYFCIAICYTKINHLREARIYADTALVELPILDEKTRKIDRAIIEKAIGAEIIDKKYGDSIAWETYGRFLNDLPDEQSGVMDVVGYAAEKEAIGKYYNHIDVPLRLRDSL